MLGYEACNVPCTMMGFLCGFQCMFPPSFYITSTGIPIFLVHGRESNLRILRLGLLATVQRKRVRRAYKIEGNIASDCLRATCCTCCTLIQDEREIRDREENTRQAVGSMGMGPASPYITPNHMSYAPPPR